MTVTEDMVYVQAMTNVLSMRAGERAVLSRDTPELWDCIRMGIIALVGPDGEVPTPPPVIKRPCGCGS